MDTITAPASLAATTNHRPDRLTILAFVNDSASETVLREGLDAVGQGLDIRRGSLRQAIAALSGMPTPRALIVDISGEDQPLALLTDLSQVVEPDVSVMVIGDRVDVAFYRQVTRGLGATEYLYKPLVPDMVARHFAGHFLPQATSHSLGGRTVSVTGVRGGVGATTVACNLSWHTANVARRHTLLIDADLHAGDAALLFKVQASPALRAALEAPGRIDELYMERAAIPVNERLFLLASEEKLTDTPPYAEGAAATLAGILRRRFNFIVADVPYPGNQFARDLLELTQQRVLVLLPTLACIRDTLRMLDLRPGPQQVRRPVLILNRAGMPGGLTRAEVEQALQLKLDVCIPDLPRPVGLAEQLGVPVAKSNSAYRHAILALGREITSHTAAQRQRRLFRWARGR